MTTTTTDVQQRRDEALRNLAKLFQAEYYRVSRDERWQTMANIAFELCNMARAEVAAKLAEPVEKPPTEGEPTITLSMARYHELNGIIDRAVTVIDELLTATGDLDEELDKSTYDEAMDFLRAHSKQDKHHA